MIFHCSLTQNESEGESERTGKWDNRGNQTGKLGRKEEGGEKVQGRGKLCMGVEVTNVQEGCVNKSYLRCLTLKYTVPS